MDKKPIIFLDFDGVINGFDQMLSADTKKVLEQPLNPVLISKINSLCDAIDGRIIVSSAWRTFKFPDGYIEKLLNKLGLKHEIEGYTPIIENNYGIRGIEIHSWLANNDELATPFVILDDIANMGYLSGRLVQTDGKIGITDENIKSAIELIKKQQSLWNLSPAYRTFNVDSRRPANRSCA